MKPKLKVVVTRWAVRELRTSKLLGVFNSFREAKVRQMQLFVEGVEAELEYDTLSHWEPIPPIEEQLDVQILAHHMGL